MKLKTVSAILSIFMCGILMFPISVFARSQEETELLTFVQRPYHKTDAKQKAPQLFRTKNIDDDIKNEKLIMPAYPGDWSLTCDTLTVNLPNTSFTLYDGPVDPALIYWYSSDSSVAKVINGRIYALRSGIAEIRAEYLGQSHSCVVTCDFTDALQVDDCINLPMLQAPDLRGDPAENFSDAVFVGDSITAQLSGYALKSGLLGDAIFLCETSYSVNNGILDIMQIGYLGRRYSFEDAVAATGRNNVFIMLGTNDIGIYGINTTIARWGKFIQKIRDKNPDVTIYIQSIPPMWNPSQLRMLNNRIIRNYNQALRKFAKENGCEFIDIAPYLTNGDGGLVQEYSFDKYVHLSTLGLDTWARVLNAHMEMYKEDFYEEIDGGADSRNFDDYVSMRHTGHNGHKAYA